jgi:hypothetical protein
MKKIPFNATPAIAVMLRDMNYELVDTLPRTLVGDHKPRQVEVLYALPIDGADPELAIVVSGGGEDRYSGTVYFYQWEIVGELPALLDVKNADDMVLYWDWKSRRRFNEEPTEDMVYEGSLVYLEVIYLSAI